MSAQTPILTTLLSLRPERWRDDLLTRVLWVTTILGALVCVPSVYLAVRDGLYVIAGVDVLALLGLVLLLRGEGMTYRVRAASFCTILYLLSCALLIWIGPISQIYLFGFSAIATLLLGLRAGGATLGLNAVTLFGIAAVGLAAPSMTPPIWRGATGVGPWFVVSLNFVLINAILVLMIGAVLRALESGIVREATARAEMQQREAFLRMASRVGRMGAWSVSLPDERITWSNETRAIHEVDEGQDLRVEEALGFYVPDDRERVGEAVARCALEGTPFDLEAQIVTARGNPRWVRSIGEALRDPDGAVLAIRGAFQDISEKVEADRSLRESEARFRTLCQATNDAIWEWHRDDDTLWWNEGLETLFGYPRGDGLLTRDSWSGRIHPDDAPRVLQAIEALVRDGGTSWSGEYRFGRQDGAYAYVLTRVHVIREGDGGAVRVIGGMTDLTERRATEERLAEQAELLEKAQDMIFVRDLDGHVRYMNRKAEDFYGWDRHKALGVDVRQLLFQHNPEAFVRANEATLRDGAWIGEVEQVRRDGQPVLVEARWTLLRRPDGVPYGVLTINTDIGERKRLERQLLRAQRLDSIGTLAGGIAHDLNNVLTPIFIGVELMRQDEDRPERLQDLEMIESCARRGRDMVRQILGFARGYEGVHTQVSLVPGVRDLERMIRDTFPKNIQVVVSCAPDLWVLRGDVTQLNQVMMNLCLNARDAMGQGGTLTIEVTNVELDEMFGEMSPEAVPGRYVVVRITDTGSGMPPEVVERVFEPFYTTKPLGKGTGLGLSTTHAIVKSHSGFISLYSEVGKGTRFHVYLPVDTSEAAVQSAAVEDGGLPRGKDEVLLVVDDEDAVRGMVGRTLERFGYRVLLASQGEEALATYEAHRAEIALVLTDMAMPVMDGTALVRALRALGSEVPIVGSSGLNVGGSVDVALGAGMTLFVAKPYTTETILRTIRQLLDEPVGSG